jgi:glycosyltransferase involved in cell wall biosynthesis
MAISKQTKNINELVLGEEAKDKIIDYVPHGIDDNVFKPVDKTTKDFKEFKKQLFREKEIDFVVFFNSRNIHRKRPSDTILAYRQFCDMIGKEKARKCALVMKTEVVSEHGTDLRAVKEAMTDPDYVNIYFADERIAPDQMNLLYNIADVTMLLSSNEGWGLALTESMMAGTMIIANVTGGMQDQMRFQDDKGNWIDFDANFPSNHRGTYKEHGKWARPIFPSNISLAGSPLTPYIFDDRCSAEDAADGIKEVYDLGKEERTERGLAGREWAKSEEAQMSATSMSKNISKCMEKAWDNFKPRPSFDLIKVGDRPSKYVEHKLSGY